MNSHRKKFFTKHVILFMLCQLFYLNLTYHTRDKKNTLKNPKLKNPNPKLFSPSFGAAAARPIGGSCSPFPFFSFPSPLFSGGSPWANSPCSLLSPISLHLTSDLFSFTPLFLSSPAATKAASLCLRYPSSPFSLTLPSTLKILDPCTRQPQQTDDLLSFFSPFQPP